MTVTSPGGVPDQGGNRGGAEPGIKDHVALIAAIILVLAFLAVQVWLFRHLGIEQQLWDRAVFLLTGLEAVAFAATGFLFGRDVHRARAEKAEARADAKSEEADAAKQSGETGRALALAVLAKQKVAPEKQAALEAFAPESKMSAVSRQADLTELAILARRVLGED